MQKVIFKKKEMRYLILGGGVGLTLSKTSVPPAAKWFFTNGSTMALITNEVSGNASSHMDLQLSTSWAPQNELVDNHGTHLFLQLPLAAFTLVVGGDAESTSLLHGIHMTQF